MSENTAERTAIDEELAELEKLIELQQQKCVLLRKKRGGSSVGSTNEVQSPLTPRTEEVLKTFHGPTESTSWVTGAFSQSMPSPSSGSLNPGIPGERFSEYESEDDTVDPEDGTFKQRVKYCCWVRNLEHPEQYGMKQKKSVNALDAVTRFNRLGTDLANERTMLAWTRTALATGRTVFSFFAFTGLTASGEVSQRVVLVTLATLAFSAYCFGFHRYRCVKKALRETDPPMYFNRYRAVSVYSRCMCNSPVHVCNRSMVQFDVPSLTASAFTVPM
jgi:uncharacterized membrane protein YidH (DUF202 family)